MCSLGLGDGEFAVGSVWIPEFTDAGGWNVAARYGPLSFPDVDGDGFDDVCSRGTDGIRCAVSNGADAFTGSSIWVTAFTNADGWAEETSHWGTIQFVDVNGDDADDVCGRADAGIECGLSNGTDGFGETTVWSTRYSDPGWLESDQWGTIGFPDINGDGMADVCGRSNSNIVCELSDGTTFDTVVTSDGWTDAGGWAEPNQWGAIGYPDLNGDGNADVCGRSSQGMQCALSDGTTLEAASLSSNAYNNAATWGMFPFYWATVKFADINADGFDDVCGRGSAELICGLSNGIDGFEAGSAWTDAFSDFTEFENQPFYWRTIQFVTASAGDCPTEPDPSYDFPWRTSALVPR